MSRVIFIGKTGSGKTTLCQKLNELEIKYKKTQSVEIYDNSIDTPGEYLENRNLYSALIVTAADADIIALVYDSTEDEGYFAPGFASMFCKDVIGIITKVNKVSKDRIELAEDRIKQAGVSRIFKVDTLDDVGVEELSNYLKAF
ncbi:EutP/PduV family microcompartment system protein [Clostridium sardiniense]|uniref:EutP/PduV family microcompartment system protein n=1 Tax=Clostridium sardiniense TaxID=29369 RepID=UPI003D34826F